MEPSYYNSFKQNFSPLSEEEFSEITNRKIPQSTNGTRFYLVRHGTSEGKDLNLAGGGLDFHKLTSKGKEEIQKEAQKFKNITFDAVYSSEAAASIETAQIFSEVLAAPKSQSDARLRQKHWGHSHGKPIDPEYKKGRMIGEKETDSLPTFYDKMNYKFDKTESLEEPLLAVFDRSMQFLSEVSSQVNLKDKNILVVTHTPVLKAIASALIALNQDKELLYHRHDFANGGMIVIDVPKEGLPTLVAAEKMTYRPGIKYGS